MPSRDIFDLMLRRRSFMILGMSNITQASLISVVDLKRTLASTALAATASETGKKPPRPR